MRFTLSVNSGGDYDSDGYFTAERTFNSEYLGDTVEHLENFLRSAGYSFGRLEVVNEDHLNPDMLRTMADED
jgi:hypothetical protein